MTGEWSLNTTLVAASADSRPGIVNGALATGPFAKCLERFMAVVASAMFLAFVGIVAESEVGIGLIAGNGAGVFHESFPCVDSVSSEPKSSGELTQR